MKYTVYLVFRMVETIAISNNKGGVGKTTTSVNLSAALAILGKRVLLVDVDAQAHATMCLGFDDPGNTVYEMMVGECGLKDAVLKTEVEGLDLVPSKMDLSGAEAELAGSAGRELFLRDLLNPVSGGYDFVVIDPPPSLGLLSLNALVASDSVILPIQTHFLPLRGIPQLLQVMDMVREKVGVPVRLKGILLTMYDRRTLHAKAVVKQVKKFGKKQGFRVFKTVIRVNTKLPESSSHGKVIFQYAPQSRGAEDYMKLAREILPDVDVPKRKGALKRLKGLLGRRSK